MKRLTISMCVILSLAYAAYAGDKNQIQIQAQFFRLMGNVPSKTFIDEDIWTTEETPEKFKDKVFVFRRGWFQLGKDKLEFKKGNCFWKNKKLSMDPNQVVELPEDQIRQIFSPDFVMEEHSKRAITIESKQPIQYFERREDGLFELKNVKLPTGLTLEIEAKEEEDKGYIVLADMIMTIRSVERRKKIEGVNLSVGYPILGEQKYVFFFRVRPGKDYGILIRPERGEGALLIRLRASSTASGTFSKSNAKDEDKQKTTPSKIFSGEPRRFAPLDLMAIHSRRKNFIEC